MTTRSLPRVLTVLLVVAGLFAAAVPASPAEASRPVCRTSRSVKIPVPRNGDPALSGKGCVAGGVLSIELRQRNLHKLDENVLDTTLTVKVHSTTSKGRFLNQVVFSESIWLGDVVTFFSSGASNQFGRPRYNNSAKLPEITLPELPEGIYQASFEFSMQPSGGYDREALPSGVVTTKPVFIKFKI
jgi:hypothetical protein